jgi:hypothetical protein
MRNGSNKNQYSTRHSLTDRTRNDFDDSEDSENEEDENFENDNLEK